MNYPMQSLAIIAPIVFLLLIVGIPLIGVFAGWKRMLYWGGGTFVFFLIGAFIWMGAGQAIANSFIGLVQKLLPESIKLTPKLLASVSAPIFFILVMFIAELILIINYYTWFKKKSGIKQDIKVKKELKQAKKDNKKYSTKQLKGWNAMQLTTQGKVINATCGFAGALILFAPSTIAFSQAVIYATTSAATRAANQFVRGVYNTLQNTAKTFSWMSYYGNGDTGKDYDSLFAMLVLSSEQVSYTYIDESGQEVTATGTVAEALTNVVSGGIQNVVSSTTQGDTTEEKIENAEKTLTTFTNQWNNLVDQNVESVNSVFQSDNVAEVLKDVIEQNVTSKQQLTEEQIRNDYLADDSVFNKVAENYLNKPESEQMTRIQVSEAAFNSLIDGVYGAFDMSQVQDEQLKQDFRLRMAATAALMFTIV